MAATQTIHLDRYAPDARAVVAAAQQLADERQHAEVGPLHLLSRALERRGVPEVFRKAGAEPSELVPAVENGLSRLARAPSGVAYVSARLLDLLGRAEREASRDKAPSVGVEHLLHALAQEIRGPAGEILASFGIGPGALRAHVAALHESQGSTNAVSPGGETREPTAFSRDLQIGRAHV